MRQDLLTLTPDDLAALKTRGDVKRAQRDLEEGKLTANITETPDATVTVTWSDGVVCTLPHDASLGDSHCTCPAIGVCRHLIQSVLAYQRWAEETQTQPVPPQPWNPGEITDETLTQFYEKSRLNKLRQEFEQPHVFELLQGLKPLARIHTLGVTLRFLVAHDLRYTKCDCDEPAPCSHVALAIWAFRQLEGEATIIETGRDTYIAPAHVVTDIQMVLRDLLEVGFGGASDLVMRRVRQLAKRCHDEGLIWHSIILDEIGQEHDRYTKQDARFSATHTAALAGELLIRARAITSNSRAVPSLFVRGSEHDRETRLDKISLHGLGCGVETRGRDAHIVLYFQEANKGEIIVMRKLIEDKNDKEETFFAVADSKIKKVDKTHRELAQFDVIVEGSKRQPNGELITSGAVIGAYNPFLDWEQLHAPILVENFAEMRARQAARPPAALRPRRYGETLQVVALERVEAVMFDRYDQAVKAIVIDSAGDKALLIHPYTTRGSEGVDRLLWQLQHRQPRFVCGLVRPGSVLQPISMIFENEDKRYLVQPWVDKRAPEEDATVSSVVMAESHSTDPLAYYPMRVMALLGELLLDGLQRANPRTAEQWRLLAHEGQTLGFARFTEPINHLAATLSKKAHQLDWDWQSAVAQVLDLLALVRLAQDMN